MDKVRESLLLKEGYGANSDFATADWLSMALCINRMSENYGHPSREVSLQIMKEAIEKMFTLCNKYTHTTSKGVLLSELVSAYSIRLSETDPKAAMEMTDRMTDMCLKMSEYDMGVDKSFNVTYLTRLTCFMDLSKQISYMDMSFAWNLVARIHITQCGTVAVNSKYPSHPDDFDILMRLAKGIKESIWDRELDNEFALCTAIASKLQLLQKLDFPDKNEAMELIRTYKTLEERSDIHYRKRNTRQSNEIRTIEEDLTRLIKGKPERISREDLEMMIENEEFNTIIDLFKDSSTASPEEFYYYGLALLRNGKASQAYRLYKILSDISNIPEAISQCAKDLTSSDIITLEAQSRAYDLLDVLLSDENGSYRDSEGYSEAAEAYINACTGGHASYDEEHLKKELADRLAPLDETVSEIRFKAASAASLHEFAKEVYQIWQTAGIFARKRALKELRERAGFRLEAHRIGNYVAKTFDLANEAQSEFAKAQQARFKADISYKIKPGIHDQISKIL
jgi:hypothetical protein